MHYRLVAAQSFSPLLIQPKSHYYLPIIFGPKRKKFPESPFPDLFRGGLLKLGFASSHLQFFKWLYIVTTSYLLYGRVGTWELPQKMVFKIL